MDWGKQLQDVTIIIQVVGFDMSNIRDLPYLFLKASTLYSGMHHIKTSSTVLHHIKTSSKMLHHLQ